MREQARQRRRVGAAGAVRRRGIVTIDRDLDVLVAVEEVVDRLRAVAARDDHGRSAELMEALGQLAPRAAAAGERLGLHQVGRDDRGQRKEPLDEHGDRIVLEQARAGAGNHHGIDDERDGVRAQEVGDRLDDRAREEHPRLRRVHAEVVEDRLQLRLDEGGRALVHGRDAGGVLRRQRDDRAHAVTARGGERLQVGLDAGAAARVGAGDRECAWNQRSSTPFAGITPIRFAGVFSAPPLRSTPVIGVAMCARSG